MIAHECCQQSAHKRPRQGGESERGQTPVPETGVEEKKNRGHGDQSDEEQALFRRLALNIFAEHFDVVSQRQLNSLNGAFDFLRH